MSRQKSELSDIFYKHPELQGFRDRTNAMVDAEYKSWVAFSKECKIPAKDLSSLHRGKGALSTANIIRLLSWNPQKAVKLLIGSEISLDKIPSPNIESPNMVPEGCQRWWASEKIRFREELLAKVAEMIGKDPEADNPKMEGGEDR